MIVGTLLSKFVVFTITILHFSAFLRYTKYFKYIFAIVIFIFIFPVVYYFL